MKLILVIAALTILLAALLLTLLRYFQKTRSKELVSELDRALAPADNKEAAGSSATASCDAIYWTRMNDWQVKEQIDDRRPMFGGIARKTGSASAHRADARRSLQGMYKKWSATERD